MENIEADVGSSLCKVSMAEIVWEDNAVELLDDYIGNASVEFGKSTAIKWAEEIEAFEHRVSLFPTSYTPESLLRSRKILHRSCHIMNRRFKIIYTYDETADTVHVMDIWDTRMNPQTLICRIK